MQGWENSTERGEKKNGDCPRGREELKGRREFKEGGMKGDEGTVRVEWLIIWI